MFSEFQSKVNPKAPFYHVSKMYFYVSYLVFSLFFITLEFYLKVHPSQIKWLSCMISSYESNAGINKFLRIFWGVKIILIDSSVDWDFKEKFFKDF